MTSIPVAGQSVRGTAPGYAIPPLVRELRRNRALFGGGRMAPVENDRTRMDLS
ncbi:MAG: hypothetical protein INR65_16550 [Gluconacetobacter diazotrophicus]|nr:hypothetical protein [Gluconacetobacter diazotrophicus]